MDLLLAPSGEVVMGIGGMTFAATPVGDTAVQIASMTETALGRVARPALGIQGDRPAVAFKGLPSRRSYRRRGVTEVTCVTIPATP
jgi:hypothetical protein